MGYKENDRTMWISSTSLLLRCLSRIFWLNVAWFSCFCCIEFFTHICVFICFLGKIFYYSYLKESVTSQLQ